MMARYKLLKLMQDRNYSLGTRGEKSLIFMNYEEDEKDALEQRLIALITPCKTEQEALGVIRRVDSERPKSQKRLEWERKYPDFLEGMYEVYD